MYGLEWRAFYTCLAMFSELMSQSYDSTYIILFLTRHNELIDGTEQDELDMNAMSYSAYVQLMMSRSFSE